MRGITLALTLVVLFGCSKPSTNAPDEANGHASNAPAASLTHQQVLDKVFGNIHSNSLKELHK